MNRIFGHLFFAIDSWMHYRKGNKNVVTYNVQHGPFFKQNGLVCSIKTFEVLLEIDTNLLDVLNEILKRISQLFSGYSTRK